MKTNILIATLSEHSIFGWKFNVYSAQVCSDEVKRLQILGIPNRAEEEKRGASADLLRLIALGNDLSDRELMKAYSGTQLTASFKKEISPGMFENIVRPRIETVNRKITEIIRRTGVPVFMRKDLSHNILYEHDRIFLLPSPTSCVFRFVKDSGGLRYSISLTHDGKAVSLNDRHNIVIAEKPAVLLTGKNIHFFENIEAKKLAPFFTKEYVHVPLLSEEVYLKTFVCKIMAKYEAHVEGIPVREQKPEKKACLSPEKDLHMNPALALSFRYGDDRFYPDSPKQKTVKPVKENGAFVIYRYMRDMDWEAAHVDKLLREGLTRKGSHYFYPEDDADSYSLLEWFKEKRDVLSRDFIIEPQQEMTYFTGAVSLQASYEEKTDWFDVRMTVVVGRYRFPLSDFRTHILNGKREFVLPDNTIFVLPGDWFEKYTDLFTFGREENDRIRLKKVHVRMLESAMRGALPEHDLEALRNYLQTPSDRPALPPRMYALLRPYQREGFYWLEGLYRHGFGGCLADDMGLGKTIQTIALLQHVYDSSKTDVVPDGLPSLFAASPPRPAASLVVAPLSLLHNWENELKRFAPQLYTMIYAGNNRLRTKDIGLAFNRYHVVITSYGTVRNDIAYLRSYPFQILILDESQYIKNAESQSYQAVMQLSASRKLALTGTPVENSLDDLWAQFNFIHEGFLGTYASFRERFVRPVVKEKDERQKAQLRRIIAPFLLRRTKEEVNPDLPPLQQETIYCDMTDAQGKIYETEKNRIRNILWETMDTPAEKDRFIALEGLNKLRQIANHPKLIFPDYAEDSGKFEQIVLAFENLRASGHKVLVFSSYVRHLRLLAGKFDAEGRRYAMLTGEMTGRVREDAIRRFTDDAQVHAFFISLKAGGTGLNLTAADYVFIIDPWWNPAAEMQALSRAHRIGQDKPVIAYRFISTDTVEEKIRRLQETKSALAEAFINGNNPRNPISWEEIAALLK
ncbi:MAG: DEAD/DEAH box helicase [Tannerella sp.]|nr:DEAD/DEAH box helicase [Tannerella sp.]